MEPELKQRWIEALESGEYAKGVHRLHKQGSHGAPDTFCCLGVLCQIDDRMTPVERFSSGAVSYVCPNGKPSVSELTAKALRMFGIPQKTANILMITNDKSENFDHVIGIIERVL